MHACTQIQTADEILKSLSKSEVWLREKYRQIVVEKQFCSKGQQQSICVHVIWARSFQQTAEENHGEVLELHPCMSHSIHSSTGSGT